MSTEPKPAGGFREQQLQIVLDRIKQTEANLHQTSLNAVNRHLMLGMDYRCASIFTRDAARAADWSRKAWKEFDAVIAICMAAEEPNADAARSMMTEVMTHRASVAYSLGERDTALAFARELLDQAASLPEDDVGNAVFHGHQLLGHIALDMGNVVDAKAHCLQSAESKGSPQLGSFGPSMKLAKKLLEVGEHSTVLAFLEGCLRFWEHGEEKLMEWKRLVSEGQMPDFGPNLGYT